MKKSGLFQAVIRQENSKKKKMKKSGLFQAVIRQENSKKKNEKEWTVSSCDTTRK